MIELLLIAVLISYAFVGILLLLTKSKYSDLYFKVGALFGALAVIAFGTYNVLFEDGITLYEGFVMIIFGVWGTTAHLYSWKHGVMGW